MAGHSRSCTRNPIIVSVTRRPYTRFIARVGGLASASSGAGPGLVTGLGTGLVTGLGTGVDTKEA